VRVDDTTVGEKLAGVVEKQHAVAEQTPALLGMERNRVGGLTVEGLG
jgi:hypothetical protein